MAPSLGRGFLLTGPSPHTCTRATSQRWYGRRSRHTRLPRCLRTPRVMAVTSAWLIAFVFAFLTAFRRTSRLPIILRKATSLPAIGIQERAVRLLWAHWVWYTASPPSPSSSYSRSRLILIFKVQLTSLQRSAVDGEGRFPNCVTQNTD